LLIVGLLFSFLSVFLFFGRNDQFKLDRFGNLLVSISAVDTEKENKHSKLVKVFQRIEGEGARICVNDWKLTLGWWTVKFWPAMVLEEMQFKTTDATRVLPGIEEEIWSTEPAMQSSLKANFASELNLTNSPDVDIAFNFQVMCVTCMFVLLGCVFMNMSVCIGFFGWS
jgi:hypothetical protein